MIPVGLFVFMLFILGGCNMILFFNLVGTQQKVGEQKSKIQELTYSVRFWNGKYEAIYAEYVNFRRKNISAPVSTGGPTWRNIMGFSPESKPNQSQINTRYKALAKVFHPDLGGSNYSMKLLNLAKEKADKSV